MPFIPIKSGVIWFYFTKLFSCFLPLIDIHSKKRKVEFRELSVIKSDLFWLVLIILSEYQISTFEISQDCHGKVYSSHQHDELISYAYAWSELCGLWLKSMNFCQNDNSNGDLGTRTKNGTKIEFSLSKQHLIRFHLKSQVHRHNTTCST